MIFELVLRNFDCSLEFVFSLLLLQPFNFSPVSFACDFQDWGCVILREIDFLLKICWSIPCLNPSWKIHAWIEICASLNHRKKTKADGSRLIPRKHTETLVLFKCGWFPLRGSLPRIDRVRLVWSGVRDVTFLGIRVIRNRSNFDYDFHHGSDYVFQYYFLRVLITLS